MSHHHYRLIKNIQGDSEILLKAINSSISRQKVHINVWNKFCSYQDQEFFLISDRNNDIVIIMRHFEILL